jgi:signal transduction histidine kinase
MKLAHRYTILFLVVVLVSGGVLLTTFTAHRSDVTENAETDVTDRAEQMATFLDNELREQRRVVEFAATDENAVDHGSEAQRAILESFVETTSFNGVSVVDETGTIRALVTDDGPQTDLVGSDISDRTYVRRALAGEHYVSEPFTADTGNRIAVMSVPLAVDGETVGSINAAYHLDSTKMFSVLASKDVDASVTVESNDLMLYSTAGDKETITRQAALDVADWTVKAHYSKDAIDASTRQLAVFQGVVGLVLLGTLAIFGGWVYRAQILQINQVLGQLNALEQRQYDQRVDLGGGHEWEQIEQALAELREALTQREQMLLVHNRILRHNLRNKLNVIRSQTELLDAGDETVSTETTKIRRATDTLLQLADRARTTDQLLDPPEQDARVDLSRVVHDRATAIAESYPALSVTISAPESAYAACGAEIGTAIDELLQNVVDHAGPEPTATVTVVEAGEYVVVRVEDDGDGIPESEAEVITGDHDITQLHHTVGIGLRLVDWIASRYDGTLNVPQTGGTGCAIEIELPRAHPPDETAA